MLRVKAQASPPTGRPRASTSSTASAGARRARARARRPSTSCPANPAVRDRWTQPIKVNVRNLRTRTFVTAGIAVDAPKMPHRAAIPNGPPGIWSSSRTLRRGDTYTVPRLHAEAERPRARGRRVGLRPRLHGLPRDPARRRTAGRRPTAPFLGPYGRGLPGVGRRRRADPGQAPRPRHRRPRVRRRRAGARGLRPAAHVGARRSGSSRARTTRSSTSSRSRPTSAAASATPSRRRPPRGRSRASCSTPSRATASSTRGRWRCCCGWPASPRASRPASRPARSTARPRSTSCATSTPTPGSRRGSPSIGWVTFDPTPVRRAAALPERRRAGTAAIGDAPDLGGGGALDPRAGTAATEGTNWEPIVGRRRRRRCCCSSCAGLAFRSRGAARRRPAARARARAAPDAPGARARARPCRRSRTRSPARPTRPPTCAPCASSATAAAAASRRSPSAAGCAPSWAAAAA